MDTDWTNDLTPDEAQAALDVLNANKAPITAREVVELLKLKKALQAKFDRRRTGARTGSNSECAEGEQG